MNAAFAGTPVEWRLIDMAKGNTEVMMRLPSSFVFVCKGGGRWTYSHHRTNRRPLTHVHNRNHIHIHTTQSSDSLATFNLFDPSVPFDSVVRAPTSTLHHRSTIQTYHTEAVGLTPFHLPITASPFVGAPGERRTEPQEAAHLRALDPHAPALVRREGGVGWMA